LVEKITQNEEKSSTFNTIQLPASPALWAPLAIEMPEIGGIQPASLPFVMGYPSRFNPILKRQNMEIIIEKWWMMI